MKQESCGIQIGKVGNFCQNFDDLKDNSVVGDSLIDLRFHYCKEKRCVALEAMILRFVILCRGLCCAGYQSCETRSGCGKQFFVSVFVSALICVCVQSSLNYLSYCWSDLWP